MVRKNFSFTKGDKDIVRWLEKQDNQSDVVAKALRQYRTGNVEEKTYKAILGLLRYYAKNDPEAKSLLDEIGGD